MIVSILTMTLLTCIWWVLAHFPALGETMKYNQGIPVCAAVYNTMRIFTTMESYDSDNHCNLGCADSKVNSRIVERYFIYNVCVIQLYVWKKAALPWLSASHALRCSLNDVHLPTKSMFLIVKLYCEIDALIRAPRLCHGMPCLHQANR